MAEVLAYYYLGMSRVRGVEKTVIGFVGNIGFEIGGFKRKEIKHFEPDPPYQVEKSRRNSGFLRRYEDTRSKVTLQADGREQCFGKRFSFCG
jgi:hypothetical protein